MRLRRTASEVEENEEEGARRGQESDADGPRGRAGPEEGRAGEKAAAAAA